jgi:hypothetical protein
VFVAVTASLAISASAAGTQPPVARPQPPPVVAGSTGQPAQGKPVPKVAPPATAAPAPVAAPAPGALGVPLYPGAVYLGSYDAGRGQQFYLYGCTQPFAELVGYYRTLLKDKGELVFDAPATHQFDVGRYKETDVDFTPGVTVKDYTWGGSPGYLNPKAGATPARFPTVLQIVSPPAGQGGRPK